MTPDELEAAIRYLRPTAQFSFIEADYDSLKFDVIEGEVPTLDEVKKAIKDLKAAETAKLKAKAELLDRLGITAEEAKLLLI